MKFTGGDAAMLSKLMEMNESMETDHVMTGDMGWKQKQAIANEFIIPALEEYFDKKGWTLFRGDKMRYAIEIDRLKKSYGDHTVLKDLTFGVREGEIFAVLGVNGAGKTTALECIEGLRRYDSGKIAVNGRMGIQLQSASLPACIRPMEAVRLFAKWNKTQIDHSMITDLGIQELAKNQYAELSTGQKRRLHLALAPDRRSGYRVS